MLFRPSSLWFVTAAQIKVTPVYFTLSLSTIRWWKPVLFAEKLSWCHPDDSNKNVSKDKEAISWVRSRKTGDIPIIFNPVSSIFMADSLRMCKKRKKNHCESALKMLISLPYPRNSEGKPRNMNFSKSLSDAETGDSYMWKDNTEREPKFTSFK